MPTPDELEQLTQDILTRTDEANELRLEIKAIQENLEAIDRATTLLQHEDYLEVPTIGITLRWSNSHAPASFRASPRLVGTLMEDSLVHERDLLKAALKSLQAIVRDGPQ